jgi:hypothetical protein
MTPKARFAVVVLPGLALACALGLMLVPGPARAEEPDHTGSIPAEPAHACLNQKERRAETETGKLVRLDAAMRVVRGRMPGTVVQARLCHGAEGLVYVLTVLAHDGKVARLTVDAVKGTLVGGL